MKKGLMIGLGIVGVTAVGLTIRALSSKKDAVQEANEKYSVESKQEEILKQAK